MRTISSTLLAAAQSLASEPTLSLTLHATARRWSSLWQDDSLAPGNVAALWVGQTLYRYRVTAGGDLQQQALASPDGDSAWDTWTTLSSEPAANADLAAAYEGGHWRLVYQDASQNLRVIESTDGSTWGAPTTLANPGANAWLAAAGQDVLVLTSEMDRYTRAWSGGAWSSATRLAGGPRDLPYGAAAALDSANETLVVLYAVDHALYQVTFNRVSGAWGSPRCLSPLGDLGTPDDASPRYPALTATALGYVATWQDRHSGTPTWAQEVALFSADGEHWGHEAPLLVESASAARLALAYDDDQQRILASHDAAALACHERHLDDAAATTGPLTPQSYRYVVAPQGGASLSVTLLDPDGALDPLADGAQIVAPLQHVVLSRGYLTSSGAESLPLPPLYLVAATRSEAVGEGMVTLQAVDALGLLGRCAPWRMAVYSDRSLGWLLAEVAALLGLSCEDDGDAAFARTLSRYLLDQGRPLAQALDDLLALCGAVARVDADGVIQALAWQDDPASQGDIGDQGELLAGGVGLGSAGSALPTTGVMLTGAGAAALSEDVAAGMELGLRLLRAGADWRVNSAALAACLAGRERALAALAGPLDQVSVPLRPDLELWDCLTLTLPGGEEVARRVVEIVEVWDARRGTFASRLALART